MAIIGSVKRRAAESNAAAAESGLRLI